MQSTNLRDGDLHLMGLKKMKNSLKSNWFATQTGNNGKQW